MNPNTNTVSNPKTEVESSKNMNDLDYITAQISCEKDLSVNFVYALNEASNEILYNEIFPIFKEVKDFQRRVYELMFQKGWYTLEKAEANKVSQKYTQLSSKMSELI